MRTLGAFLKHGFWCLLLALGGCLPARAEVPPSRAERDAAALVRSRKFDLAIRTIRKAQEADPESKSLRHLLSLAQAGAAIDRYGQFDRAFSRLALAEVIQGFASRQPTVFDEALTRPIEAAVEQNRREYQSAISLLPEARRLLESSAEGASAAGNDDLPSILLYAWDRGYQLVAAEYFRTQSQRLTMLAQAKPAGAVPPELQFAPLRPDEVERDVRDRLATYAEAHPEDARPYLAFAEWLELVRAASLEQESALWRARKLAFGRPVIGSQLRSLTEAAATEYAGLRRRSLDSLRKAGRGDLLSLLQRAEALDSKNTLQVGYQRFLLIAPADPAEANQLLDALGQSKGAAPLVALERARMALFQSQPAETALLGVDRVSTGTLRRPLFLTLPPEIRATFLWSPLLYLRMQEASADLTPLDLAIGRFRREPQDPAGKHHARLLAARIGAFFRTSDLPNDWAIGTRMRRQAVKALLTEPDLTPQAVATLEAEYRALQENVLLSYLPISSALFVGGQIHYHTPTGGDEVIAEEKTIQAFTGGLVSGTGSRRTGEGSVAVGSRR